jgi:peptidoglycan/LPS O-acetylase OafA/YrhL
LPQFDFEVENNYDLLKAILLGITFFANILITYSPGGIIEVLWSIGIEEQFYLFIAPVIFLLPKKRIILFLLVFTVAYFAIFAIDLFPFLRKYGMLYFYFSLSGLIAIVSVKYSKFILPKFVQILIIVLTVIYFSTSIFKDHLPDWGYQCFSVILFSLFITELTKIKINLLENNTLKYFGKISYGIYMYHPVIIQIIGFLYLKIIQLQELPFVFSVLLFNILVIIGTLLVSHFSYKYFEGYFLRLKKNYVSIVEK